MKICKQNFMVIAIAAITALTLSACFSPWEESEGELIINLGNSGERSAMPWPPDEAGILNDINYVITLSGRGTIHITAKSGETIRATVSARRWNVDVKAYYQDKLYATGNNSVDVKAGHNNPVSIKMNKADELIPTYADGTPGLAYEAIGTTAFRVRAGSVTGGAVYIPAYHNNLPVTEIGHNDDYDNFGKGAFEGTAITAVTIGARVTTISDSAFYECTSLTSVTLPASVTTIGNYAFGGCTALTGSVTIPASVTSIGVCAFNGCTGLTGITVDSSNPNYSSEGGILYNKAKTTLIQAPIASISGNVTIPASVTTIGEWAFSSCNSLASITIPASVTSIGIYAFRDCTSLTSVTFAGTIPSANFNATAFDGDLSTKYLANGAGTYTRVGTTWTKQP